MKYGNLFRCKTSKYIMGNEKQMRVNRKELEMGFEISSKIWEC